MTKTTKKPFMYKQFFKLFKYLHNAKSTAIGYLIVAIFYVVINFFIPIIMGNMLASIPNLIILQAASLMAAYVFLKLFSSLISIALTVLGNKTMIKVISNIRNSLLSSLYNTKTSYFDNAKTGDLIERVLGDASSMAWSLIPIINGLLEMVASLFFVGYLFTINVYIGLGISLFVVLYYLIDNQKNKQFIINHRNFRKHSSIVTSTVEENLKGVRDIKILNAKQQTLQKFEGQQQEFYKAFYKRELVNVTFWSILNIMSTVFFVSILLFGIYLTVNGQFTLAGILIIYTSYDKILNISSTFSNVREKMSTSEVNMQRVAELLDLGQENKEIYSDKVANRVLGKIEFKNVDFAYKETKKVLHEFNLLIQPQTKIGIVGKSGSGKSTILGLLSKMYFPDNGEIKIDDININDYDEKSFRNTISYVSQSPYIFNTTLYNNICISNPNASKKQVVEACKLANIHDFILKTDKGYDTVVGENGYQLSGGQKQRLAIARALLNRSQIVLLDEATSALDNDIQHKVQSSIFNEMNSQTVIIVAHRLSTIKDCNRIIVMDKGKIVGDGTHDELLASCVIYKQLYKTMAE